MITEEIRAFVYSSGFFIVFYVGMGEKTYVGGGSDDGDTEGVADDAKQLGEIERTRPHQVARVDVQTILPDSVARGEWRRTVLHNDNQGNGNDEDVTHLRWLCERAQVLQESKKTREEEIYDTPEPLLREEGKTPFLPLKTRKEDVPGDLLVS